ncbi:MAG: thioredoxin domain-containing protein [Candidatus Diapherotrites archaeon]|nr:thioredoxin domain-containing protein [Candidatus Diapherotrites archaeon]
MAKKKATKKKATAKKAVKKKTAVEKPAEQAVKVEPKPRITKRQAYAIAAFVAIAIAALVWLSFPQVLAPAGEPPSIAPAPTATPVPASITTLTIINDPTCGVCGENNLPEVMAMVFSEIEITEVDAADAQGLIESLNIKALPAYVFSEGITQTANFTNTQASFRQEGDYYVLDERAVPDLPARYFKPPAEAGEPSKGSNSAGVTIIEFTDPTCGACRIFYQNTTSMLENEYPEDVRFVFKTMPISEYTLPATLAMECAFRQGKFWTYTYELYGGRNVSTARLAEVAAAAGLNMEAFQACVAGDDALNEILGDQAEAMEYAVVATPTIFINGIKLTGIPPEETLKEIIDAELA